MSVRRTTVDELAGGGSVGTFLGADHGAGISFFAGEMPAGAGPRLHRHPYEETFVVHAGSGVWEVDGETFEGRAGDVFVVPAGAVHRFVGGEGEPLRWVSIHPVPRMEQEFLG